MDTNRTIKTLASITDEGLFERLATTILREASPLYESLVPTGVNVDGKTVKAPLDGICFVSGARPPHLIVVHHTTSASNALKRKWLYDPDAGTLSDKSKKSSTPLGDFIKTAKIVAEKRKEIPDLRCTLVLTTNQEPSEEVISEVEAEGYAHDIEIDLWSRSRLAHFLDNYPVGHWIRRQFLKIEQRLLSPELLHELSLESLKINHPPDDAKAWIPRDLDKTLASSLHRDVTFVVAGTGQGKSVACYRKLDAHVQAGGFGLVLSHDDIASATTLDQAIANALRQLYSDLASGEETALSICSPERPLLLVVEDINTADRTQFLAEKIANWSRTQAETEDKSNWHLLCPLWPETLALLGDQARKIIEPILVFAGGFSENEGSDAVIARARLAGNELSSLSALSISRSLGHDPLLIALYDFDNTPDPGQVIGQFVNNSLSRTAATEKEYPSAEYHKALLVLAEEMLAHRQIDPHWLNVREWTNVQGDPLRLIARIAHDGALIRLTDSTVNQRLVFRHDRVRDWILADAAAELEHRNALPAYIVAEPYYAEVIGTVLVSSSPEPDFLRRVAEANPLALFHALRLVRDTTQTSYDVILQAIDSWLDNPATHDRSNLHLRLEALAMLAETDSQHVPAIARKFSDRRTYSGQLARLRNGETTGGIELCMKLEPGVGAPWRDIQIEHAKLRHGTKLSRDLDDFLRREDLNDSKRLGALRLAGHIGNPGLARAIEICWNIDDEKIKHLDEYLWAFGQCCGNEPARFLGPVCDAWAALPDEPKRKGDYSPRNALAAHGLRFAFRRCPPRAAIDYFIQRATHDDLKWPITFMLHSIDHPKALAFLVQELAAIQQKLEGTESFSIFAHTAIGEWRRAQEEGRPMSDESRELLLSLWQNDENDKFLRSAAFSLWAATEQDDDLDVLRRVSVPEYLADRVLEQRLIRGDQQAIPALIEKLRTNNKDYWWYQTRYLWSPELTDELDKFLSNRDGGDRITSELIMRLPTKEAERLLLKHWDLHGFSPNFVQAALYVATEPLLEVAAAAIKDCSKPAALMMNLGMNFGIKVKGRPGLKRESQVLALAPYLNLLSDVDILMFWDECNDRGWFATRKKLLDSRLQASSAHLIWNRDRVIKEFDSMVEKRRQRWIDRWIDQRLKADVSWNEIFATLMVWLEARQSLEALEVVASAVAFRGGREDLRLLRAYEDMNENGVKELICDTEFAVRRRTLS